MDQRRRQGGLPPWGNFAPLSANSSSVKKSSYFKMLHPENLMNTAKYCTMRRSEAKRLSASGGFAPDPLTRDSANEPSPLILSRTDNLRLLHS